MPITVTRARQFLNDADGDNVADPGDTFTHIITVINGEATAATNLFITESENGIAIDAGSFNIGPIAVDDNLNTLEGTINGNTPVTFTSAQLLANDIDPDDLTPNLTITKIGTTAVVDGNGDPIVVNDIPVTNGTVTANGDGTFTFSPTTGFEGAASFTYSTEDEDGVESVASTPGLVSITVSDAVWYIDSAAAPGGDGSFENPFQTMAPISTGGGSDALDDSNDIIFIYDRGGTYTTSIVLEAGQVLYGDSKALTVNGHAIGASTNNTSIQYSGVGVTLSTNNTIDGLNLTGTANSAIGIEDGNGSVSSGVGNELKIDNTSIMGSGKAIDIDQGGNLDVTLDTLSSQNSTTQGVQLAGTAASGDGLLTGTFSATAGTIQTASDHNFQIGSGAANSGGVIAVDYDGALNTSISGSAVHISNRIVGAQDIRFDGNIFQDSGASTTSDGIVITTVAAGNITFSGTKTIDMVGANENAISVTANSGAVINFSTGALNLDTDSGHGFAISQSAGQVNVTTAADIDTASGRGISITGSTGGATNFTGGGLTITTTTGDALHSNNAASGSSLTISGSGNTLATTLGGQLVDIANTGSSAITFDTMNAGAAVADDAISVVNLDGGTWTTNTITVIGTTGAGSDGIVISGGSSTNFNLGTVNLGTNTSAISDDGIELNGIGGNPVGTVTATSVNIQNTGGQGVEINTYNNTVNLNGGSIGNVNDSVAEGVLITGNGGDVTIAASVTKTTAGNVVEVNDHDSGTVTFSGAISATGNADNGILITNSGGGTIAFTNASKVINTGSSNANAVTISNNGAAVDFTGGGLVITTQGGTGISAGTIAAATGGDLTISGTGNTITSTTGSAFVLNGTDSDGITLQSVSKSGGTATAIYIKDAGTDGFTITGVNSNANSGGTISNVTDGGTDSSGAVGTGVYIENTDNIVLEDMLFGNATTMGNFSIYGLNVNNFTLRDSVINGSSGDIAGGLLESGIFFDKLTGVGLFEGNNISGGFIDNMRIDNDEATGTLNLFVRDNATSGDQAIFGLNQSGNDAADSLNVQVYQDGTVLALIDGVTFTGYRGDGIQISAFDTANTEVTIQNSAFSNNHSNISSGGGIGILVGGTSGGGSWGVDYTIQNNTVTGSVGPAIAASFNGISGLARGLISGNTVGTPGNGVSDSTGSTQGSGIFVSTFRSGGGSGILEQRVNITGNTLRDITHSGINVRASNGPTAGNNAITEATITNNSTAQMNGPPGNHAALYALAGGAATDNSILRLEINNNSWNINGTFQAYAPIYFDQIFGTAAQFQFPSYVGTDGENNDIINYLTARSNTFTLDADQLDPGSNVYSPDAIMNPGTLQTPPNGSDVQLPTGAMQADPAGEEPDAGEPTPSDPTPPTDDAGDPGDGGDGGDDAGDGGDTGGDTGGDGGDTGGDPEPEPGHPVIVDDNTLTQAELDYLVEAAIDRWAAAGASAEQLAAMRATHFSISEMMGTYLGTSTPGNVYVDSDGAGHGWFLDHTPGEDSEFDAAGGVLKADADGAASGKMDLLTVLMHELGHQVGLDDLYNVNNAAELMYGYARLAERRLPQADDLAGADMSHAGHESFIESSPTVASLPAGKGVNITYTSTVVGNPNGLIGTPFSNTSTVETDNFADVVSLAESLVVDTLTLGDTVYVDANNNDQFDSGEGFAGVTVTLYADTDASGDYSAGDVAVAGGTDTTDANGNYGWTNLDAGTYIVVVDAANFTSGGVLEGYLTAPGTADPDDNVDNDDNGVDGLGGVVASKAITLAFNTETIAGTGNDTNNTLDFGFLDPNDAPVITSPATASGNEDTSIAVTGISIADVDAGTADLLVTLSIANGTLDLGTTTGLTVIGENSGLVTLEGTLTNLNNALATLTFNPTADFNGSPVNLSITANDQGATGPDPGLTGDANSEEDTATVAITVNAVVDIADDTVNLTEDAGATDLTGANDPLGNDTFENSGRAITAVSDPTNGTAVIDDNDTPLDLTDDFIVYTPDDDYAGADSFTYTVTSGGVTEQATINVNLSAVNDEPTGTDDDITAVEDTFRPLSGTDFGFQDVDAGDLLSEVIISAVTGVTLYIDTGADGFDDPGDAVSSFPVTVTAAQLLANQVAIKAAPNANGNDLGTITFKVVDDSGEANDTAINSNVLTVDVTAVNDAPTLQLSDTGPSATLNYDEGDLASAMAPTAILDDIDSPNFGGGSLTVSFAANGTSADQLDILAADGITTSGTDVLFNLVDIGDFSGGVNGADLVITFDSDASVTAVEALIHAIGYSNTSDDPSELARTVNYLVDDGDGGTSTASANATVNVNAINDGPVNTPGGVVNIAEDSGATTLSGMSIADPDSGADDIIVGFSVEHGTLNINTGVVGGITAGDIQFQDASTIVVVASQAEINATLADAAGLTYTPDANYHGNDTLEIATNDNGENGDDPGLTGDANNEQDLDTRQISISAVNDQVSSTVTSPINVNEDTAGALTLSIADIDTVLSPNGIYQVTLTATNGTTTLTTTTGLTFSAGNGDDDAVMTFRGTLDDINAALATASFTGDDNYNGAASVQIDVTDDVLGTVATGSGSGTSDSDTISITVDSVDDDPTATGDAYTTNEATDISGQNLLANEADPDGGASPTISEVNGEAADVNTEITLDSGAKLTVNSDGTFTYKPNDAFDDLAEFGSGASNTLDADSFTYTLTTGGTATVNITIQGDYSDPHLMLGTAGDDTITGTFFDDIFSPGTGADTLTGHQGDDVYEVDNAGDQTIEAFGEGTDEVRSTIDWTLHKHIEDLTLLGAATTGTGNQLANTIVGNVNNNILNGLGGADEMRGGGGDDLYYVQSPNDQAIETSLANGTDTVVSSANQYTLGAFVENLIMVGNADRGTGNGLDNLIIGNAGGNIIDGKAGSDEMRGGAGDDLYHVDNAGDVIVELNGGGNDTARATVSYTIGHGVNHLELAGTALNGTGNNAGNHITGNAQGNLLKGLEGNDRLTGGNGDDKLVGGLGNDRLQGDAGADTFYFTTTLNPATNVDDILDYSVADDTIKLDVDVFDAIGLGTLSATAFHTGATPTTAAHRIIYDSATGNLYYDEDGNGSAHDQILFATLDTGLALTNADFVGF